VRSYKVLPTLPLIQIDPIPYGKLFKGPTAVTLYVPIGQIYVTLNDSSVSINSKKYNISRKLVLTAETVVRAQAFLDEYFPSPEVRLHFAFEDSINPCNGDLIYACIYIPNALLTLLLLTALCFVVYLLVCTNKLSFMKTMLSRFKLNETNDIYTSKGTIEMNDKTTSVLCKHCTINEAVTYCVKCELNYSNGLYCNTCDEEFHIKYPNHIRELIN